MIFRYLIHVPIKPFSLIKNFFRLWYIEGSDSYWQKSFLLLGSFEQEIAVIPTIYHWLSPLYQDYSIMGRVLGPIFRTGRIIFGITFYFIIIVAIAIGYLVWMGLPIFVLVMILLNIFG